MVPDVWPHWCTSLAAFTDACAGAGGILVMLPCAVSLRARTMRKGSTVSTAYVVLRLGALWDALGDELGPFFGILGNPHTLRRFLGVWVGGGAAPNRCYGTLGPACT